MSGAQSLGSWKLDLLETANADPLLRKHSSALRLLLLSLKFVREKERTAYVPNTVARVRANIRSSDTLAEARRVLVSVGYWTPTGKLSADGSMIYLVTNARAETVEGHIIEATETVRDQERVRKGDDRRRALIKAQVAAEARANGGPFIEAPQNRCPSSDRRDRGSMIEDKHLEPTPGYLSPRNRRVSGGRTGSDHWGVYGTELRPWAEIEAKGGGK